MIKIKSKLFIKHWSIFSFFLSAISQVKKTSN